MREPEHDAALWIRGLEVRPVERFDGEMDELRRQRCGRGYGNHFTRDAAYFNWRYRDSPRDYRCFGAYRNGRLVGVAVVGHTFKHGVSAGLPRRPRRGSGDGDAIRRSLSRAVAEVKEARTRSCSFRHRSLQPAACAPPGRLRADEQEAPLHRQGAPRAIVSAESWTSRSALRFLAQARLRHFTLGDFDFFYRVTKLLFITQQVDPRHPALAATVPKIRALAELVDEVVVLADGAVSGVLPDNCRVHVSRAVSRRCAALVSRRRWRASSRPSRRGRRRPHVPDLRRARRAARSATADPARPLVHPLACSDLLKAAERASTAVTSVDYRSFRLPSRSCA